MLHGFRLSSKWEKAVLQGFPLAAKWESPLRDNLDIAGEEFRKAEKWERNSGRMASFAWN